MPAPEIDGVPKFALWHEVLTGADRDLADDLGNSAQVFADLPLEVFASVLLDVPIEYPRLHRLLPVMPDPEVQIVWTAEHGRPLLRKTLSFVQAMMKYADFDSLRSGEWTGLDFGFGWGRILAVMLKFGPPGAVDGLDVWQRSHDVARASGLQNRLEFCDALLEKCARSYDLIWAFSVFTHLDREAFEHNLTTLLAALTPGGTAVVTVRPPEYWLHPEIDDPEAYPQTLADGFTFRQDVSPFDHYGNTAVTLDFLRSIRGAELVDVEWSPYDALQVYAAFRPAR